MPTPQGDVYRRVTDLLRAAAIPHTTLHHEAVFTSAEAAAIRGTTLHSGAKALIVKAGEEFLMLVLPADLPLDSRASRQALGCKQLRFATKEEVLTMTGLTPGSIPPFGSLFQLRTVCDDRLAENESINFNAGSHTDSVQLSYADYIRVEAPRLARIGGDAPSV